MAAINAQETLQENPVIKLVRGVASRLVVRPASESKPEPAPFELQKEIPWPGIVAGVLLTVQFMEMAGGITSTVATPIKQAGVIYLFTLPIR